MSRLAAALVVTALLVAVACGACGSPGTSTEDGGSPTTPASPSIDAARLAEAVVGAFVDEPFIAHVEQAGTVTSGTTTAHVDASGDVDGDDLRILMQVTGEGTAIELEMVILGDDVWVRLGDQVTRTTRTAMAEQIAPLARSFRIVDDPAVLEYAGIETIEGRDLHHFTAAAGAVEYSDSNSKGSYDVSDLYALADGTPVLVKGTFTANDASGATGSGTTEIRFSNVGGPIAIEEPSFEP